MVDKPVILVVDDDMPILALMRNLLKEFGFQPVTASNGEEAVATLDRMRPALVLLDKNMPGMPAAHVVDEVRRRPGYEQLPILILSGEPVTPKELILIGANAAILKPFDLPALISQIRAFVGVTEQATRN